MTPQRLRITYAVDGPLRYASNLDLVRAWARATRRAGLVPLYSGGFNARPRIQNGAALPVGFSARGEMVDLWLSQRVEIAAARQALAAVLPAGLAIRHVVEVDEAEPALPTRVQAAEYAVTVETGEPHHEIRQRVANLLSAASLPRERRGRPYDLRPLIEELAVAQERAGAVLLHMRLAAREGATGRPEQVLDALGLEEGFFTICRQRLLLSEG
ncbi:MAG: DUF2344 domain-containing protein [Anaerolineae bacterium]|nr:DUF2344 domain-containing protein [Anaerolineae bacterium]